MRLTTAGCCRRHAATVTSVTVPNSSNKPIVPVVTPSGPAAVPFDQQSTQYCLRATLKKPPPPEPTKFLYKAPKPAEEATTSIVSVDDFVPYIPWFFVPVEEVLKAMPGYTEDHIHAYFSNSKVAELVKIGQRRFIRLYGGYDRINFAGSEEAEESFQQYRPNPRLLHAFIQVFGSNYDTWMPVRHLMSQVDPQHLAQLPFAAEESLLYFAQMQHVFGFAASEGGAVMLKSAVHALDIQASPLPKVCNELLELIPLHEAVDAGMCSSALLVTVTE